MKSILVIGLGRFGRHVVMKLCELDNQVMAVDINPDRVNMVLPYVTNAVIGDSTDTAFLKSLGIRNFDVCIVGIGDNFQSSLETTCMLKELGATYVVSRASRGRHARLLLKNGADEVVYPEEQMANYTALKSSADHILDYIRVSGDYGIFEITAPPHWVGKTIQELDVRNKYHVNVMAIKRNDTFDMDIFADTQFMAEDTILVLGQFQKLQHMLEKEEEEQKKPYRTSTRLFAFL